MGDAGRTVLVVDDEPSIRMLCRVNLELEGYRVLEATSLGSARYELARGVDVVLLDVHLGQEDGRTLLNELRRERPNVAVAIFTGSYELAEGEPDPGDAVIPKPFAIDHLIDTVARLAGRGRRLGSPISPR